MATLPGQQLIDTFTRIFGKGWQGWPGEGAPPDFDHVVPDFSDAVLAVTNASAGVRVPEQVGRETFRVKFEADAGNSAPVIVQRGLGSGGSTAPPFTGEGAFSVPAGKHFWAGDGPVEKWWIKAADDGDVVHLTAKRTP